MKNLKLSEPIPIDRINKCFPSQNGVYGDPSALFLGRKLNFHFGTKENKTCGYAWLVLNSNQELNTIKVAEIIEIIISKYSKKSIIDNALYLNKHGLRYEYVVFYDNIDWQNEDTKIFTIEFYVQNKELKYKSKSFTKISFQQYLVELNGLHYTKKPLRIVTTNLEGYLSDRNNFYINPHPTDTSLFPMDADVVLFDENYETKNLIELKKRTYNSKCEFEEESFAKYKKDRKKYEGLSILAKQLNRDYFYNIIYSTKKSEEKMLKIEKIDYNLNLLYSKVFEFSELSELKDIFNNSL